MHHKFTTPALTLNEAAMRASLARRVAFAAKHNFFGRTAAEATASAERDIRDEAEHELVNLKFALGIAQTVSVGAAELASMSTEGRL